MTRIVTLLLVPYLMVDPLMASIGFVRAGCHRGPQSGFHFTSQALAQQPSFVPGPEPESVKDIRHAASEMTRPPGALAELQGRSELLPGNWEGQGEVKEIWQLLVEGKRGEIQKQIEGLRDHGRLSYSRRVDQGWVQAMASEDDRPFISFFDEISAGLRFSPEPVRHTNLLMPSLGNVWRHALPTGGDGLLLIFNSRIGAAVQHVAYILDSGNGMPVEEVIVRGHRAETTGNGRGIDDTIEAAAELGLSDLVWISKGERFILSPWNISPVATPDRGTLFTVRFPSESA